MKMRLTAISGAVQQTSLKELPETKSHMLADFVRGQKYRSIFTCFCG
ncbi:MAG: hypothetical protein ACLVAU_13380 [Ruminococcus sp.]